MVEILSWNIQQGGGSRISKIKRYLEDSKAHIIVLSEYRNNANGLSLRKSLLTMGYRYQLVSHASTQENSVIIVSKIPFNGKLFFSIDPHYSSNLVLATFTGFKLYGGYFPHKKKHILFDYLLADEMDLPTIITGDLNTGINNIDQAGTSFWYQDELKSLHNKGLKDAFRLIHGDLKEYSWYSHQGNGYRYDHYLVHDDIIPIVSDCRYDHEARMNKLSDHSPMFLTLGKEN